MDATKRSRLARGVGAIVGVIAVLLMCGPITGRAYAAAVPDGDAISIGSPDARAQIDLFVDPMCPFSGKFIREEGGKLAQRIEAGTLHVNLRFVNFLERLSASGTYDARAIYAAFVVAGQSQSSDVTWRFVQQIFSAEQQPKEKGATDLDNDQLAGLADHVGAPPLAQGLIKFGVPIGYDPHVIAANNLAALHEFSEPGVPLVAVDGKPVDTDTDWLAKLPS